MPDDLAATLDEIRERYEACRTPFSNVLTIDSADDVPQLLAAVDAVLALAADWKQESVDLDAKADGTVGDSLRRQVLGIRAQGCDDHSRALSETLSRALPGEHVALAGGRVHSALDMARAEGRAEQREACVQLAIDYEAVYAGAYGEMLAFADRLRDDSTDA